MKKILAAWLLLLMIATIAVAQTAAPTATPVTIDPAEYKAYQSAITTADPAQKGAALEQFVLMYPKTSLKEAVLVEAMAAYQQANNIAKVQAIAQQILDFNPNNLRALALLTFTKLQTGEQLLGSNQTAQAAAPLGDAAQFAQKGMQALPNAATDADTQKLAATAKTIFTEALGMNAYATGNYADTQKYLRSEVESQGNNASLTVLYFLSLAYLQAKPLDCVNGCFFGARVVDVAAPAQQQPLNSTFLYYYKKYHGSDQGWQDILTLAKTTVLPPAGFTITPAPPPPTPAQQAADVLSKYQPKDLSLGDWLFILGSGYQQGADQVWDFLKGKKMEIQGTVLSTTPNAVVLMVTDDAKAQKKGEITVTMKVAFKTQPAAGSVVDYDAVFASYTASPTMIIMSDGSAHAAPAAHHTTPASHKKGTH